MKKIELVPFNFRFEFMTDPVRFIDDDYVFHGYYGNEKLQVEMSGLMFQFRDDQALRVRSVFHNKAYYDDVKAEYNEVD